MTAEIGVLPFTLDVRLPPESLFQFLVFRDLWQSCSVLLGDEALLTLQTCPNPVAGKCSLTLQSRGEQSSSLLAADVGASSAFLPPQPAAQVPQPLCKPRAGPPTCSPSSLDSGCVHGSRLLAAGPGEDWEGGGAGGAVSWGRFCSRWLLVAAVQWGSRAAPIRLADPQTSKAFHGLYSERISHTDLFRLFFFLPTPPPFFFSILVIFFSFFFWRWGWVWGLFPNSGTGGLFAFPCAFFSGPGEQRLVMGVFAYVSHANVVFSCTERHSNH